MTDSRTSYDTDRIVLGPVARSPSVDGGSVGRRSSSGWVVKGRKNRRGISVEEQVVPRTVKGRQQRPKLAAPSRLVRSRKRWVADEMTAYFGGQLAPVRSERHQDAVAAVATGIRVSAMEEPVVGHHCVSGVQLEEICSA
jgi:hypothetical protein